MRLIGGPASENADRDGAPPAAPALARELRVERPGKADRIVGQ
jgi:hypothetical protein